MDVSQLNDNLRRFYAETRTQNGEIYSRSSLLSLRSAIERHLNNPPFNRGFSISRGPDFKSSNKVLNAKIKIQKKNNQECVKHKAVIECGDIRKLRESSIIRWTTPWGLLRNVWFHYTVLVQERNIGPERLNKEQFLISV